MARDDERREIDRLAASAAAGCGGAVVVAGEAGIGKSALVDSAVHELRGFSVLRTVGAEFERGLLYAALHQLCAPVLDHRLGLPAVQREALEAVFGLGAQTSPDPLTVGLAVLGLLHEAAQKQPVCCVVDDAQWIDDASRQVLVFVARRVAAERIALVFATREVGSGSGLDGLPRLPLTGLGDEDARRVLGTTEHTGLDEEVFDRILAEARGNPLALLEFAHDPGPYGVPSARRPGASVADTLAEQFVHRWERLPEATRTLVVLAAAEPVGDLCLLYRAARLLGLDAADLDAAEDAGLLTLGPRLRFRHPLVRSAVYASATPGTRRRVHGALAEATDPGTDPDRRVWHRAHAVIAADEDVAAELERSADRARCRGGFAAAAAFMERAGHLTPADGRQAGRLLSAARLRLRAGAPAEARALVVQAKRRPMDDEDRTEARLLCALLDYQVAHSPQATARLVDVVTELAPDQAGETYVEAFASIMYNDHPRDLLHRLGARIRKRPAGRGTDPSVDQLLDALLDQAMGPVEEAVPAMREVVAARRAADALGGRWKMNLACQFAIDLRDDEAMEELPDRQVEMVRREGALAVLPQALRYQALSRVAAGRFDDAGVSLCEARAVDEAAGRVPVLGTELVHAGFCGDRDRFHELRELVGRGGRPLEAAAAQYASAVLYNGLGDYEAALDMALTAQHRHENRSYVIWGVYSELAEAAARTGRGADAAAAVRHLEALARANPVPWAVAEWLQARALLGDGEDREKLYREAVENFARTRVRVLYARARLTYGEWLRREHRRSEARTELRAAHDMLAAMGARAFAERAARELRAAGEQPRRPGENPLDGLTPQERHIVAKVAAGATSKEVAAMLFLSPRTVDAHLRNVYRKLGISSRRELRGKVP
ncbi:AAA family ATPase [Streptomyces boncukensis]|uniref:AAA family ATPase n=1 Tax=Streptomyces boncukensis TaxID=2711219 RepID=A0A6G4WRU6_9ACTN|nr:AAA family ATPase [Streptomyces boncukensis]